ncbi:uncharacterized protein LOC121428337 [Lytechinus variegatus]|uniref:uncharacterized protein LOC121428337 n=1 Tax=Lytechinus variegatus TaxID=7654 RepID=UPI001BB1DC7E|nr:uncharacterized protein LOC121428337 [Lytechinus variegatus]
MASHQNERIATSSQDHRGKARVHHITSMLRDLLIVVVVVMAITSSHVESATLRRRVRAIDSSTRREIVNNMNGILGLLHCSSNCLRNDFYNARFPNNNVPEVNMSWPTPIDLATVDTRDTTEAEQKLPHLHRSISLFETLLHEMQQAELDEERRLMENEEAQFTAFNHRFNEVNDRMYNIRLALKHSMDKLGLTALDSHPTNEPFANKTHIEYSPAMLHVLDKIGTDLQILEHIMSIIT